MVDLVKLRKKAKASAERGAGSGERGARSAEPPSAGEAAGAPPSTEAQPTTDNRQPTTDIQSTTDNQPPPASRQPPAASPSSTKLERFKSDAGKLRETADEAKPEQDQTTHLELLTFVIAGEQYAVDIERIVEIVRPRSVTRVPNADPSIVGIVSLRGTIVTLVDVRKRLRHAAMEETPDTRIIVVDHQGETIGFEVDRVLRVVKIGRNDVEPHPVVHASEADESIRGVFRHTGALTILLDFDKLLALPHGNHL
jgi:purine-binding chemotaxis protein CheW